MGSVPYRRSGQGCGVTRLINWPDLAEAMQAWRRQVSASFSAVSEQVPTADPNQWRRQYAALSGRRVVGFENSRGVQRRNRKACDRFICMALVTLRWQQPGHTSLVYRNLLRRKTRESKTTIRKAWENRAASLPQPSKFRRRSRLFSKLRRRNAGILAEIQKDRSYHPRLRRRKN